MTPELRRNVASRAAALRARLNAAAMTGGVDAVQVATEARRLFEDAADETRVRWLNLEIGGYGGLSDTRPLHDVLRVPPNDRLVAHVGAYRTQRGAEVSPNPGRRPFAHFFVEGLAELVTARDRVRGPGGALELDFSPQGAFSGYPSGEEPSSVDAASCPPSLSPDEVAEDEPHALESAARRRSKDSERMAGSFWKGAPEGGDRRRG